MASFACGTRDEPYMPPPGQTPCCWSVACHGEGARNIYKLKATSCGLFCIRKLCPGIHVRSGMRFPLVAPLGNCIPLRLQIPGRIFHQNPQPETASYSKGEFRDAFSDTPPIWKARPALNTSGHGISAYKSFHQQRDALPGGGHVVHREFRTQRKPLNVASFAQDCRAGNFVPAAREGEAFRRWT